LEVASDEQKLSKILKIELNLFEFKSRTVQIYLIIEGVLVTYMLYRG
jgi:hypothetical protein